MLTSVEKTVSRKDEVIAVIQNLINHDSNGRPILKTQSIVNAAREPSSILHSYFTWEDSVAAERWRNEEAGRLIRSLRITLPGNNTPTPVYVSIMEDRRGEGGGYRQTSDVITSEELMQQLAATARIELRAWKDRYKMLTDIIELGERWLKEN